MPFYLKTALAAALSVAMLLSVVLPARFDVLAPRLGKPAVVLAGDSIVVNISTSVPFWRVRWQAWLALRDTRIPLKIARATSGAAMQTLALSVPQSVGEGAYALVVTDGDAVSVRPKAVFVRSRHPPRVSIVQLADLPTLSATGEETEGDRQMQQLISEINIINPDLVLMTGDIAYGGSWAQYSRLLSAMERFNAPLIAVAGNHEHEGWAAYLTLLGAPYHSVRVGNLEVISLNSGHGRDQLTESQYAWLQETLARAGKDRIPLVQIHHPLHRRLELGGYVRNHVADMVALFRAAAAPIVLSGHWHGDAVYDASGRERRDAWDFRGTPYVVTTAAGADLREQYASSPLHHGYRLIRLDLRKGRDSLITYTYDMDGDGERDAASSIPVGKLHARQFGATTLVIENGLHETLTNALAVIRVPGNDATLAPDRGRLLRRYKEDQHTVYEIGITLAAMSQTAIKLIKSAEERQAD